MCDSKTEFPLIAKFVKIWAQGLDLRVAWIELDGCTYGFRISHQLYDKLYKLGVPTSQKLRYKQ